MAATRLVQEVGTLWPRARLTEQQPQEREVIVRRRRRTGEGGGGEFLELRTVPPDGRAAEPLTPGRIWIRELGDPQESINQRSVLELERHKCSVLDCGNELVADRRSA